MNGSGVAWDSLLKISDPGLAGSQPQKESDITNFLENFRDFGEAVSFKDMIFGFRATSVNGGDSIKLVQEVADFSDSDRKSASGLFAALALAGVDMF
jgi:hypothetical protein